MALYGVCGKTIDFLMPQKNIHYFMDSMADPQPNTIFHLNSENPNYLLASRLCELLVNSPRSTGYGEALFAIAIFARFG